GGTAPGAGNLISGNTGPGVALRFANRDVVQGNVIGADVTGTVALGNEAGGTVLGFSGTGGGPAARAGNTIAFNAEDGVLIDSGPFNTVRGNVIFGNGGLGIELVNGGNAGLPAPLLTAAAADGTTLTLQGTYSGSARTSYTLDLFAD